MTPMWRSRLWKILKYKSLNINCSSVQQMWRILSLKPFGMIEDFLGCGCRFPGWCHAPKGRNGEVSKGIFLKPHPNVQEGPARPQCEDLQGARSGSRPVCQEDLQDSCELKQHPVSLLWVLWILILDSGGREPCKYKRTYLLPLCSVHPKGLEIMICIWKSWLFHRKISAIVLQENFLICIWKSWFISQKNIRILLQENFSAMTRLDQNRAAGQIAEKVIFTFLIKWFQFCCLFITLLYSNDFHFPTMNFVIWMCVHFSWEFPFLLWRR